MDSNLKMQGEIDSGLLRDLLQVLARRKTLNGYVEVKNSATTGRIWVQEGVIIAADWNGRQGELALECMLRLKQGFFTVGEAACLPARAIFKDTVVLLMQCLRAIGRDTLTPSVSVRVPPSGSVQNRIPEITGRLIPKEDDPVPAPVHPPVARPRKRGVSLEWQWRKPATIAAGLALVVGLSVMWGAHSLFEKKELALTNPIPPPLPPVAVVAAPVPVASPRAGQDGWPDIILSALAASNQRHYCAILNGQLLGVGEQVDGVTVRSIRSNGVVVEYLGQRRFLCAAQKR
jgi:hypothetical protein